MSITSDNPKTASTSAHKTVASFAKKNGFPSEYSAQMIAEVRSNLAENFGATREQADSIILRMWDTNRPNPRVFFNSHDGSIRGVAALGNEKGLGPLCTVVTTKEAARAAAPATNLIMQMVLADFLGDESFTAQRVGLGDQVLCLVEFCSPDEQGILICSEEELYGYLTGFWGVVEDGDGTHAA